MEYPKKIMRIKELKQMGFAEKLLLNAYRIPGQRFAMKENFLKPNSPIIFDTDEFEKWRLKNLETENRIIAGRR